MTKTIDKRGYADTLLLRALPCTLLAASLLWGCTSGKIAPDLQPETSRQDKQDKAGQAVQQQLAHVSGLLRNGDSNAAREVLARIDLAQLDPGQTAWRNLLYAQCLLDAADAEQALSYLANVAVADLPAEQRRGYYEARLFALGLVGQKLPLAQARVDIAPFLSSAQEQQANQKALLDILVALPANELQQHPNDVLGGWMALALLLKQQPQKDAGFGQALQQWQQQFPNHPAQRELIQNYTVNTTDQIKTLHNIALLLPESGPLRQVGQALKAGIDAAAKADTSADKPKLLFYNSDVGTPAALYQQALKDGADLVVGPLEKDKLKQLASDTPLSAPVLGLNEVPGLVAHNLYQFALSPIDEAEQVAKQAYADGHRRALLLLPQSELGKRIGQAYNEAWQALGGSVLATVYYPPGQGDFTATFDKLLADSGAQARYRQLAEVVPGLRFNARPRVDADVLLLNADPNVARKLYGQWRQRQVQGIAAYATSHLYANAADPGADEVLDGVTFCDAPWFFPGAYPDTANFVGLQQTWKQYESVYLRLLAMGLDSYQLATRLTQMAGQTYAGATGNLSFNPDGRLRRELYCAQFSGGIPEPLGFAGTPATAETAFGTDGDVAQNPQPTAP